MKREMQNNLGENSQARAAGNPAVTSAFADFSPLGHIPLAASKLRRWNELRAQKGFLQGLVSALGQDPDAVANQSQSQTELYPWLQRPILLTLERGKVLVGSHQMPLNLADFRGLKVQALLDFVQKPVLTAHLLFAGEYRQPETGQTAPVLVLTGGWEDFIDFGSAPLNLLGPDGEQQSITDVLATQVGGSWLAVRSFAEFGFEDGAETAVAREWGELLAAATALDFWHARHAFDPATGEATEVIHAGWARKTRQGGDLFPRTDPAVITAVTATVEGQEKILLGQARAWAANRFSTFAGFVEVGESLENAVAREIAEECGGEVVSMTYMGSQPWPFPRSLMLGFRAQISNPGSVQADGDEIERVRWFSRRELFEAHSSESVVLPGRSSISRKLIEDFYGGSLDEEPTEA